MPVVRISDELFREVQKHAEPLVDNFESALWKALGASAPGLNGSTPSSVVDAILLKPKRRARSYAIGPTTRSADLWMPILASLVEKGGAASRQEVHRLLMKRLEGRLKPGDLERNRDGSLKIERRVDFQRLNMVHKGLLRRDSPRGTWEITDTGRQWLAQHSH